MSMSSRLSPGGRESKQCTDRDLKGACEPRPDLGAVFSTAPELPSSSDRGELASPVHTAQLSSGRPALVSHHVGVSMQEARSVNNLLDNLSHSFRDHPELLQTSLPACQRVPGGLNALSPSL